MATARGTGCIKTIGRFEIFADDDHIIGSGVTGIVYSGIDPLSDDNPVVAKKNSVLRECLEEGEYEAVNIPPHENILEVLEFHKHEYTRGRRPMVDLWSVTPYCTHESLDVFAYDHYLTDLNKIDIMYQSALAVQHLHSHDLTHGDIKPENILLTGDMDQPVVKLADFGASRWIEKAAGTSLKVHALAGTLNFLAPEQLEPADGVVHQSVDIYSLGLTLLALLEAKQGSAIPMFKVDGSSLGEAMWKMKNQFGATWSGFTPNISKPGDSPFATSMKQIITKMIQTQPSDRIPMSDVLQQLTALKTATEREAPGLDVRRKTTSAGKQTSMLATPAAPKPSLARPQQPRNSRAANTRRRTKTPAKGSQKTGMKSLGPKNVAPASARVVARHCLALQGCRTLRLGSRGEIYLLADSRHIYRYKLDGETYSRTLVARLPQGLRPEDWKAVSEDNCILTQAGYDNSTVCYNAHGKEMYRLNHEGALLSTFDGDLCYKQETGDKDEWMIQIYPKAKPDRTSPVTLRATDLIMEHIYVYRSYDRYYVTEVITGSLSVFSTEGNQKLRKDLQFYPRDINCIAVVPSGHVLILNVDPSDTISIYDDCGMPYTSDLRLDLDKTLHGICYSDDDELLHVVCGSGDVITSLRAYKLQYKPADYSSSKQEAMDCS